MDTIGAEEVSQPSAVSQFFISISQVTNPQIILISFLQKHCYI